MTFYKVQKGKVATYQTVPASEYICCAYTLSELLKAMIYLRCMVCNV